MGNISEPCSYANARRVTRMNNENEASVAERRRRRQHRCGGDWVCVCLCNCQSDSHLWNFHCTCIFHYILLSHWRLCMCVHIDTKTLSDQNARCWSFCPSKNSTFCQFRFMHVCECVCVFTPGHNVHFIIENIHLQSHMHTRTHMGGRGLTDCGEIGRMKQLYVSSLFTTVWGFCHCIQWGNIFGRIARSRCVRILRRLFQT